MLSDFLPECSQRIRHFFDYSWREIRVFRPTRALYVALTWAKFCDDRLIYATFCLICARVRCWTRKLDILPDATYSFAGWGC